jgi:hydrogenase maturation protein HypF
LILTDPFGRRLEGDPVVEAIRLLAAGKVVAVKGIGGFHLACDALNHSAVADLRRRKGREEKPFAVMMRDMATVEGRCRVSTVERELLTSTAAPIVLLPKRGDCVAPNVAPFVGTLGVMLPYSPLHHLIFRHPAAAEDLRPLVLVMTSGNYSEEPLARGNDEALERLSGIADAFLMHNRDIELRADDSIMRVIAGGPTVFRTSRGLVPCEFTLAGDAENNEASAGGRSDALVILGAGGDVKNALCIIKGRRAIPGPHIGDLASPAAQDYFVQSAAVLTAYVEASPDLIAVDPHPEYYSNRLAEDMRAPVREVYHHHAHAVSLLTQHRLEGPELFAVFDGAGYGPDGTIWGGEFLVADRRSFTREAHIGLFALPGGEAAIRDPARILAGLIAREGTLDERFRPLLESRWDEARVWLEAMRKGINSPLTSSVGRLFDAAAFAAGFKRRVAFEGQAAMWLEAQADPSEAGSYRIRFNRSALLTIDPRALITQVADDALNGYPPSVTAARFHNAVAGMILEAAIQVCGRTGGKRVGLTGGCFQNRLLTEKTAALLEKQGFEVLLHRSVPPNDGGIALGQAVSQL